MDFEIAKKQYVGFLIQNYTFWKQWAKQFWLAAGDANTRYFHSMASSKKRRNKISRLKDNFRVWHDSAKAVERLMENYFHALYTSEGCSDNGCLEAITPLISVADNAFLIAPFSEVDIKEAFTTTYKILCSGYLAAVSKPL